MRNKYQIGTKIGNLTITEKVDKKYIVTCDCGQKLTFGSREMKTKSNDLLLKGFAGCGSCSRNYYAENRSDVERYRYIYNAYKKSASVRNIKFDLNREEFTSMILAPCFYCDDVNSNQRKDRLTDKYLSYNGIDRLDSNLDYTTENTVSCCSTCNYMKGTLNPSDFIDQVKRIYNKNVQRPSRKGVDSSESKQETPIIQE